MSTRASSPENTRIIHVYKSALNTVQDEVTIKYWWQVSQLKYCSVLSSLNKPCHGFQQAGNQLGTRARRSATSHWNGRCWKYIFGLTHLASTIVTRGRLSVVSDSHWLMTRPSSSSDEPGRGTKMPSPMTYPSLHRQIVSPVSTSSLYRESTLNTWRNPASQA